MFHGNPSPSKKCTLLLWFVTLPISQLWALQIPNMLWVIFPILPPRLCAGDGVILIFIVALWCTETVKTNLSLYYPTGRQEIRIQRLDSNKSVVFTQMGALNPPKNSDIIFCTWNFPPLHFEVINFIWISREQTSFIFEFIINTEKEGKDLPISIGKSISFSFDLINMRRHQK